MAIIRQIVAGVTDPKALASLRNSKCRNSEKTIEESLKGNYRKEHLFLLEQALGLYDFYAKKISECDVHIEKELEKLRTKIDQEVELSKKRQPKSSGRGRKSRKHEYSFELGSELKRITGVDLTVIPGIGTSTALTLISEIGLDMSKWKGPKQFASWLGLSPGNKISGRNGTVFELFHGENAVFS